jgi:4,5:9,10-diseco-3-hydroxy-5,9,17-trioxoandrosta-1(10),2-diene-4-oate hydrolase
MLMNELGIDSARVVGNSMGGFVAVELAIRYPARVERLVLAAPSVLSIEGIRTERGDGLRHAAEELVFSTIGWVSARAPILARRERLRSTLLRLVAAHPDRLAPELVAEQVRGFGKPGFAGGLSALCSHPIRKRLGEIGCPTLIVWGTRDLLVPVWEAARFRRLIPGSRTLVYRDTGHVTMMERPARFNADVRAFLQAPGHGAGG